MSTYTHETNTTRNALPNWDVFVTPGIPIVTPDKPPDVRETYFQAMASTLIYGVRDAVLVDAFMTVKQADRELPRISDWHFRPGTGRQCLHASAEVRRSIVDCEERERSGL